MKKLLVLILMAGLVPACTYAQYSGGVSAAQLATKLGTNAVVPTTGASDTDVMSQNAVTEAIVVETEARNAADEILRQIITSGQALSYEFYISTNQYASGAFGYTPTNAQYEFCSAQTTNVSSFTYTYTAADTYGYVAFCTNQTFYTNGAGTAYFYDYASETGAGVITEKVELYAFEVGTSNSVEIGDVAIPLDVTAGTTPVMRQFNIPYIAYSNTNGYYFGIKKKCTAKGVGSAVTQWAGDGYNTHIDLALPSAILADFYVAKSAITPTVTSDTNTVPSNLAVSNAIAAVQAEVDLWENPTNGITQAAADARYSAYGLLHGVNLFSGTNPPVFYGSTGSAITSAYASAVSGDIIRIGIGEYDIGAVTFTVSKSVSILGSGSASTKLLANSFYWTSTSTNCLWEGLTLEQRSDINSDFFNNNCSVTNILNVKWDDIVVVSKTTSATKHCMQWAGANLTFNDVHTFASKEHPWVFKASSNVLMTGCSSYLTSNQTVSAGLLIRADTIANGGESASIEVRNFKSNGMLYLDNKADSVGINNISIYDSEFGDNDGEIDYCLKLGTATTTYVSNYLSNIILDGIKTTTGAKGSGCLAILSSNGGVSNVVLRNIVHTGLNGSYPPTINNVSAFNSVVENFVAYDTDGTVFNINNGSDVVAGEGKYSRKFGSISNGAFSNRVRAASQTTTGIWVVVTAGYEPKEANLVAGDPVILEGGDHDGAYKLVQFSSVTESNSPITGALVGDYAMLFTDSTTTNAESVSSGNILVGKVAWKLDKGLSEQSVYSGKLIGSGFWAGGTVPTGLPSYSECNYVGRNHVGSSKTVSSSESGIDGQYVDSKAMVFMYNGSPYAGLFCSGTDTDSYVPSDLKYGMLSLSKISMRGQFSKGVSPVTVLP